MNKGRYRKSVVTFLTVLCILNLPNEVGFLVIPFIGMMLIFLFAPHIPGWDGEEDG